MDDRIYRTSPGVAIMLTVAWVGWSIYTSVILEETPGDNTYLAGNSYFEDGRYEEALREYQKALTHTRGSLPAVVVWYKADLPKSYGH
jgi:tetratricopeptide (TPR) repeat protein